MAASYPNAVKTFVTNNPGDKILSAYVNEIRDEVTAIESGLLNGTAPFSAGPSTLAALSVPGGSTLATLNAGNSTFTHVSAGASTIAGLNVTAASTLTAVSAGASTLASLSVTGNSTLAAVNAGASTLASLSVSGASTLTTVQAGASTLATLNVAGGSTLQDLMPAADSTYALGNSTRKWNIHGSQLSTGTVPVAALASTAGTPSTATFYRGDGEWATPAASTSLPQPRVSVFSTVTITAPTTDTGMIFFESEQYDVTGFHSTSVNPSRLTVPAGSSGFYLVHATVHSYNSTAGSLILNLRRNDSVVMATIRDNVSHTLDYGQQTLTYSDVFDAGEWVDLTGKYATAQGYFGLNTYPSRLSMIRLWGT